MLLHEQMSLEAQKKVTLYEGFMRKFLEEVTLYQSCKG